MTKPKSEAKTNSETDAEISPKPSPKPKKPSKAKKTEAIKPESFEPELVAAPETQAAIEHDFEPAPEAEVTAESADGPVSDSAAAPTTKIIDPIGDETDGEAKAALEDEPEFTPKPGAHADGSSSDGWKPRPPAKLERLQKILAAAGVASRRSAEGMIEQGRVQVNGKVITELGTKADAGRDHIRVDGKLLQGPERLRYFVLNKPKGFVTTVKDPEGRPTVMQFFDKMKERLYPVGRLDYMSEGLLVVTNDGELANRLTKASSGVEKTYLVKVAGQPTEAELDILRGGVAIERGKPGSPQVRTSPARIRQVRQGDNPWYEVVLIEGRNRELRKMFEEIGHFVEKIRRVGYGPLVLDQEPGNLRELEPIELEKLRLAAEGKLRTPKSKELRRRNAADAGLLPTVLPKPSGRPRQSIPPVESAPGASRPSEFRPKKFGPARPTRPADSFASGEANKFFRADRPSTEGFRPSAGRTSAPNPVRSFSHAEEERPRRKGNGDRAVFGSARPAGRSFDRTYDKSDAPAAARSFERSASQPAWKKDARPTRPPARFAAGPASQARPTFDRPRSDAPRTESAGTGKPRAGRPFADKPAWKKPERSERPARPDFKRTSAPRRDAPAREARVFDEDLGPVRPPNLHIEEITGPDRSSTPSRPSAQRSSAPRASYSRPSGARPYSDRPAGDRPSSNRPFTTSSGKPRPGGARPSSKPGRPTRPGSARPFTPRPRPDSGPRSGSDSRPSFGAKRPYGAKPTGHSAPPNRSFRRDEGAGSAAPRPSRPFTPRSEGASDYRPTKAKPYPGSTPRAERKAGTGWKPKPSFGTGKPAFRSKPKPGSSAKPSHRVKPGGKKRG